MVGPRAGSAVGMAKALTPPHERPLRTHSGRPGFLAPEVAPAGSGLWARALLKSLLGYRYPPLSRNPTAAVHQQAAFTKSKPYSCAPLQRILSLFPSRSRHRASGPFFHLPNRGVWRGAPSCGAPVAACPPCGRTRQRSQLRAGFRSHPPW